MKNKLILISSAVVYKRLDEKILWFVVKQNEETGWEIPKTTVRRGESSVRAVIRAMGEQGGMRTKVFEEVGRGAGSTSVNGKIFAQRYLYYLMVNKGDSEVLGFTEFDWLTYPQALRRLKSKKDQAMLAKAKEILKEVLKDKRDIDEEEDLVEEELAAVDVKEEEK